MEHSKDRIGISEVEAHIEMSLNYFGSGAKGKS